MTRRTAVKKKNISKADQLRGCKVFTLQDNSHPVIIDPEVFDRVQDAPLLPPHLCQSDAGAGSRPRDDSEHGWSRGHGYDAALSACAESCEAKSGGCVRPGVLPFKNGFQSNSSQPVKRHTNAHFGSE